MRSEPVKATIRKHQDSTHNKSQRNSRQAQTFASEAENTETHTHTHSKNIRKQKPSQRALHKSRQTERQTRGMQGSGEVVGQRGSFALHHCLKHSHSCPYHITSQNNHIITIRSTAQHRSTSTQHPKSPQEREEETKTAEKKRE